MHGVSMPSSMLGDFVFRCALSLLTEALLSVGWLCVGGEPAGDSFAKLEGRLM